MFYKLPCSCGSFVPVETNQAGRQVTCVCGKSLQVPTMSKIVHLEPLPSPKQIKTSSKDASLQTKKPSAFGVYVALIFGVIIPFLASMILWLLGMRSYSFLMAVLSFGGGFCTFALSVVVSILILKMRNYPIRGKHVVIVAGVVAFLVTGLFFAIGTVGYPQLHDVCLMNRFYDHGGQTIGRDTQPISFRDRRLLIDERNYVVWTENTIKTNLYSVEKPLLLIEMHDHLKGGLEFSPNFYEKYDRLVFYYWARFVILGVLTVASFITIGIGVFMPKQTEEIGERGGESWE